ncbi:MAG: tetratricopeptide repeat-containing sensor histidine kinase [Pedobacter sp.]|nr:MAG: tetratricopeptide repeat-containing sensor histidine kinase [Pedobacter sp.]
MKYLYIFITLSVGLISCSNGKKENIPNNINPLYEKAFTYLDSGIQDSAFLFFNKAKDIYIQQNDSLGYGKCLLNMAIISTDKGDFFGSQELSLNAISYFNEKAEKQFVYIQSNYNNLGVTYYYLKDYVQSLYFYNKAKIYTSDIQGKLIIENNIANIYRRSRDFKKSLAIYSNILSQKISKQEFARTLSNFAYTKWLQNPGYNASPKLIQALEIRRQINDIPGQISSYTFLTDFYSLTRPVLAAYYANKMYDATKKIDNPNDKLEALQRLVRLSAQKQSKKYFDYHQVLNDSLQTARNAAKNQFALIRYESEKSKADNLRLQKENTEKTYQVNKQKIVTYLMSFLFVLFTLIGLYLTKKRRERLELSSQNKIKEGQLKISKKVHDVVANGLYRVMTEIENQSGIGKEEILDRLDGMYQKSRDISYEVELPQAQDYHKKINSLLKIFESERVHITIEGNTQNLWEGISASVEHELEHILQEFMVNMDKHSQASHVSVRFSRQGDQIAISYHDDGIGVSDKINYGNGLKNTGNRIKNIQGEIIFGTKSEKGLEINFSFPVSQQP